MKMRVGILSVILSLLTFTSGNPVEQRGISSSTSGDEKLMVCYYASWAVYRHGNGHFDVENIDPTICTHLIYTFVGLNPDTSEILVLDPHNDLEENWGKGAIKRFVNLKQQNPGLKVLVAIGGWEEKSEKYSNMVLDPKKRAIFVQSALKFVERHGFDGLDLDWEYPANRENSRPEDKENFVLLVQELKAEFVKRGYLLTAAVSAGEKTIATAYDIPALAKELDFINVMAYDMHGAWETYTGHHAPLKANPNIDFGDNLQLNLNHSINYWISNGCPANKLVLGMGTYGRGYTLDNAAVNGLYAPANQPIPAGPFTGENGFWGYNELCERMVLKEPGQWVVKQDPYYEAPYALNLNQRLWIGYDSPDSIRRKTEWALEMGLAGGMVWSLETDDFLGQCHGEPFILVKTIVRALNGGIIPPVPTTTVDPNLPTTTTTTTPAPPTNADCPAPGLYPYPSESPCSRRYYWCVSNGQGGWVIYHQQCTALTIFYADLQTCAYPSMVPGCGDQ